MTSASINRRTLLQVGGVALALPWLEATSLGYTKHPTRLITSCATLGLYASSWFPQESGSNYEASEYLKHIDSFRSRYTLFSGLEHLHQSGRQPHNSELTWLTSALHPGLDGFRNSLSLDQAVGNHYGYVTRFPSIVLATKDPKSSQSYTSGGVMIPPEISPSRLFSKLFLQGDAESIAREQARLKDGASVLDQIHKETASLIPKVSESDKHKLESYFTAIRATEANLVEIQAWQRKPKPSVNATSPEDIEEISDMLGRIKIMYGLIPLMLETDSTRSISLMIQDHGVVVKHPGVTMDLHNLSHHGQEETKIGQLRMVETAIVKLLNELLASLTEPDEHGVSLLDSTIVLFGSNLGNANAHTPKDLPILVAGGSFKHGQHHVYSGEDRPPLSNLYVSILQDIGVETDSFGHSTGSLTWS